jgi:hypothetical protein
MVSFRYASTGSKSIQSEETRKITLEVILNCPKCPVYRMSFGGEPSAIATVEFFQTLLELVMLDVDIPRANSAVDIRDTVRMVKLQVQKAAKINEKPGTRPGPLVGDTAVSQQCF